MRYQNSELNNLINLQASGPPDLDWLSETAENGQLTREQLIQLLTLEDFTPVYALADKVRRKTVGDEVHIRAIIEFSNICARQCKYCGLDRKSVV